MDIPAFESRKMKHIFPLSKGQILQTGSAAGRTCNSLGNEGNEVKRPKCEADRSPLFSAKVMEWCYVSIPTIRRNGMIGNNFTVTSSMQEVTKLL